MNRIIQSFRHDYQTYQNLAAHKEENVLGKIIEMCFQNCFQRQKFTARVEEQIGICISALSKKQLRFTYQKDAHKMRFFSMAYIVLDGSWIF